MKKLLVLVLFLLALGSLSVASAAKYTPKGPLAVPRIPQTRVYDNGNRALDCHICSLASVQAYMLGSYQFTPNGRQNAGVLLKRTYTGAGDYTYDKDPVWWKLYQSFGWDNAPKYDSSLYPLPMTFMQNISQQTLLSTAYAQLSRGVPLCVYKTSGPHASVIIGYRGNSDTLKASDFTVMEIKPYGNGWQNSKAYFNQYASNPSTTYSSSVKHCYVTLSAWLGSSGIKCLSYPTGTPSPIKNTWLKPNTTQSIAPGSSITFTYGADQAADFYLHTVDLNTGKDTNKLVTSADKSGSYTYTFNTAGSYNIFIGARHHLGDKYTAPVTVNVGGHRLSITSPNADGGMVTGATDGSYFAEGKTVSLTAVPTDGYLFSGWTVNGVSVSNTSANPLTFSMPANDVSISAAFARNPLATTAKWSGVTTSSITKTNASISGKFTYSTPVYSVILNKPAFSNACIYIDTDKDSVEYAQASVLGGVSGGHTSTANRYNLSGTLITYQNDTGLFDYKIANTSLSSLGMSLSPGTKYYYKLGITVKRTDAVTVYYSNVYSFTTSASTTTWSNLQTNLSGYGLFNGTVKWPKSLTMQEVGCFVSTDLIKLTLATRTSHSGVAFRQDVGNIKTVSSMCTSTTNGTIAFYKGPSFDTITSFQPGVTYYYKFYSYTSDKETVYSPIAIYTPAGGTTYDLTINAGEGGHVLEGSAPWESLSMKLASGGVTTIKAAPAPGYAFNRWTATAGTIASASDMITSFTMPSKAATVTASFSPINFSLQVGVANAALGQVDASVNGSYHVGDKITLTATATEGATFAYWVSDSGGTFEDATSTTTVFTMPPTCACITAVFDGVTVEGVSSPKAGIAVGESIALNAIITGGDAADVYWYSSDPDIISVDQNGIVTGMYPGSAGIFCCSKTTETSGYVILQCLSSVDEMVFTLNGNPSTNRFGVFYDLFRVGEPVPYSVSYHTSDGSQYDYRPKLVNDVAFLDFTYNDSTVTFLESGHGDIMAWDSAAENYEYYGEVIVLGDDTLELPAGLTEVESEAFAGSIAKIAVLPDSLTSIGEDAFPGVKIVMLNTSIPRQIAINAFPDVSIWCETGNSFNNEWFSNVNAHGDIYLVKMGTRVPEIWGEWTEWVENGVPFTDECQVESKTQYRYRDKTTSTSYSAWGNWSAYSKTRQTITDKNLKEERSATVWPYYYYKCTKCGQHSPVYGITCLNDNCSATVPSAWTEFWLTVNPSTLTGEHASWYSYSSKKWTTDSTNGISFFNDDSAHYQSGTGYSYRTRKLITTETWSNWSEWSDVPASASGTREVETRTMKRFRYRIR